MSTMMQRKLLGTVSGAGLLLLFGRTPAEAFAMGIPLDAFLGTLATSITGLGFIIGTIGLAGMVYSRLESQYSQLLSGFLPFFVNCGFLGGGAFILGGLGLVSGAVLP